MAMGLIEANGATLYYERRGSGPTVLFISGATGDAGHWTEVGHILADEDTVVTYDRRANSRSPRPPGWDSTTSDEQADDAAALLTGLHLAPAVVFGTSAGTAILANLCLRHPELLSGAVFHEPYFQSGVSHPDLVRAWRRALIEKGMAMGGPSATTELLLRSVAGDETYERMDAQLRERLLSNGDVFFDIEMAAYLSYEPTPQELETIQIPCAVTAGADNRDESVPNHWRYEAAQWLAAHLHTTVVELPGGHMSYLGQPHAFAEALQQLLHSLGN
jgi:pimeloyl-ACP methyl ester carboxylesterase